MDPCNSTMDIFVEPVGCTNYIFGLAAFTIAVLVLIYTVWRILKWGW